MNTPRYPHTQIEETWRGARVPEGGTGGPESSAGSRPRRYLLPWIAPHVGRDDWSLLRRLVLADTYARQQTRSGRPFRLEAVLESFPGERRPRPGRPAPVAAEAGQRRRERAAEALRTLGVGIFEDEIAATGDPAYIRVTQILFLRLLARDLVLRYWRPGFGCPRCGFHALEQDRTTICPTCSESLEEREVPQWRVDVLPYAERLFTDIEKASWPAEARKQQKALVGRRRGTEVLVPVSRFAQEEYEQIPVFTTRVEAIYGATFLLMSPDCEHLELAIDPAYEEDVRRYQERVARGQEPRISGARAGGYALNPANHERIPIIVSPLASTLHSAGVMLGLPGHDPDHFELATRLRLRVREVIHGKGSRFDDRGRLAEPYLGEGILTNSGPFSGQNHRAARDRIVQMLSRRGMCAKTTRYALRSVPVSELSLGGPPVPLIHCERCGCVPVPESGLPVELPLLAEGESAGSPAELPGFLDTRCPSCGEAARRDPGTILPWLGRAWSYLRPLVPELAEVPEPPAPPAEPESPEPESPEPASPATETPEAESPAPESPAPEIPEPASPAPESAQAETPETETPETETPEAESPAPESPAPESPEPESPEPESPEPESPEPESPAPESAEAETPEAETPAPESAEAEAPEAESPEAESPAPERAEAESPEAESAAPEAPETETPETETPETETAEAGTPETGTPEAETPETETPETGTPETGGSEPEGAGAPPPKARVTVGPEAVGAATESTEAGSSGDPAGSSGDPAGPEGSGGDGSSPRESRRRRRAPRERPAAIFPRPAIERSLPVDTVFSSTELTTTELVATRFLTKFLYDQRDVPVFEPFRRFFRVGRVDGPPDGEEPELRRLVEAYGADAVRVALLEAGPPASRRRIDEHAVHVSRRFLDRLWREVLRRHELGQFVSRRVLVHKHRMIYRVTDRIRRMRLHTAVAAIREFVAFLRSSDTTPEETNHQTLETFLIVVSPFAPFLSAELWSRIDGPGSIFEAAWPQYSEELVSPPEGEVQIWCDGRLCDTMVQPVDLEPEKLESRALQREVVRELVGVHRDVRVVVRPPGVVAIVLPDAAPRPAEGRGPSGGDSRDS